MLNARNCMKILTLSLLNGIKYSKTNNLSILLTEQIILEIEKDEHAVLILFLYQYHE